MRVGAEIQVSAIAQVEHPDTPLVKGDVVSIECDYGRGGAQVIVRGYASSHRLHRGRHTRTFLNVTDTEIVKRVAEEAGIELGDLEQTSEVYEHVAQANISDWEFITGRAARIGYQVWLDEDKLNFGQPRAAEDAPEPADGSAESAPTDPRQLVFAKNLHEFRGRLSAAEQVGEVEVRAWDTTRKVPITASAPAATVSAELELSDPHDDGRLLRRPGLRGGAPATAHALTWPTRSPRPSPSESAALLPRPRVWRGGHPELRAGTAVNISGVGEDFSGKYVLSHVRHVLDREGYQTHFTISGRQDRSLLGMVSSGAAAAHNVAADMAGSPSLRRAGQGHRRRQRRSREPGPRQGADAVAERRLHPRHGRQ